MTYESLIREVWRFHAQHHRLRIWEDVPTVRDIDEMEGSTIWVDDYYETEGDGDGNYAGWCRTCDADLGPVPPFLTIDWR